MYARGAGFVYNNLFELYLQQHSVLLTNQMVIFDQFSVIGAICPKSPCGPELNIHDQLSVIKPSSMDVAFAKLTKAREQA